VGNGGGGWCGVVMVRCVRRVRDGVGVVACGVGAVWEWCDVQ
jgi:hypothetical protein